MVNLKDLQKQVAAHVKDVKPPTYKIGVADNAYCLVGYFEKEPIIILTKQIQDKQQFEDEVNNLSKYFDAEILRETN
jgi:hypothetical protein